MRIIAVIAIGLSPVMAVADDVDPIHPYLGSKYYASAGLFSSDQNMKLGLASSVDVPDREPVPFETIDFSETFGFTDNDRTFSAEIGWRFGEKWQLRGQYFRIDSNTRISLEEDVEWGDYVFNEGTFVGAGHDYQITRLFAGRTFRSSERREMGLGIGAHMLDISAYVNGSATINGVDVGFVQERASIAQPLPNFGAWYMHAMSPKWAFSFRFDWLSANIGKYDGRIVNSAASVGYAVTDHFGIALAYNYFEIALKVDDPDWTGRISSRFDGPYIALTGYW